MLFSLTALEPRWSQNVLNRYYNPSYHIFCVEYPNIELWIVFTVQTKMNAGNSVLKHRKRNEYKRIQQQQQQKL